MLLRRLIKIKREREDKQRELDLQEQLKLEAAEQELAARNQESKANKDRKAAERKIRQAKAIAKEQEGTTVPYLLTMGKHHLFHLSHQHLLSHQPTHLKTLVTPLNQTMNLPMLKDCGWLKMTLPNPHH